MSAAEVLKDAYAAHSEALSMSWPNAIVRNMGNALLDLREAVAALEGLYERPRPRRETWAKAEDGVRDKTETLRALIDGVRGSEIGRAA